MNPWQTARLTGREGFRNVHIVNRLWLWANFFVGPAPSTLASTTPGPTTPSSTARKVCRGVSLPYWGSAPTTTILARTILPPIWILVIVIIFINSFFVTTKITYTYSVYIAIVENAQINFYMPRHAMC